MIKRGNYKDLGESRKSKEHFKEIDKGVLYRKVEETVKMFEDLDRYLENEKVKFGEVDFNGYEGYKEELLNLAKEENYKIERKLQPYRNKELRRIMEDKKVKDTLEMTTVYMVQKGYILPRTNPYMYIELFKRYYDLEEDTDRFLPEYKSIFERVISRGDLKYLIDKNQNNSVKGWESMMDIHKEFVKEDEKVKSLLYVYYPYLEGFIRTGIDTKWGEKWVENKQRKNHFDIANEHIKGLKNEDIKIRGSIVGDMDEYQTEFYKALWVAIKREFLGRFVSNKEGEITVYSEWVLNRNTITHGRVNPENIRVEELYSVLALLEHLHIYKRYLNGEEIQEGDLLGFYGHRDLKERLILMRVEDTRDGSFEKPYYKGTKFNVYNNIGEKMEFKLEDFHVETNKEKIKDEIEQLIEDNGTGGIILEDSDIIEIAVDIGINKEDIKLGKVGEEVYIEFGVVDRLGEVISEGRKLNLTKDGLEEETKEFIRIYYNTLILIEVPEGHKGLRLKVNVGESEKYVSLY